MIIESDMSQNSEQSPFFDPHIYQPRDTLCEILSIEIPKTKVIVRKRPLNQKELSQKEVDNISIVDKNKVVITELKKKLDLTKYIDKKEFIFDRAYDEKSSNDLIYKEEIRPMIYNAFIKRQKLPVSLMVKLAREKPIHYSVQHFLKMPKIKLLVYTL